MSDIAKMIAIAKKFGGDSGGTAPVVILPETELTYDETEENMFGLLTPWAVEPVAGNVYVVTYNGVEYECEGVLAAESGMPIDPVALGNLALIGLTGGNADAPFAMVCYPNEGGAQSGLYAALMNTDGETSITLSIVQTEGASSDAAESPVVVVPFTVDSSNDIIIGRSFDNILALANSGKVVFLTGVFAYTTWFMQLVAARDNGEGSQIVFASGDGKDNTMSIVYTRDGATLNT